MQVQLENLRFFAKPKLGLDAVGSSSALRIADSLAEVGSYSTAETFKNRFCCLRACKQICL